MTQHVHRVASAIESMPFAQLLQLSIEEVSPLRTVISMPIVPSLTFDGATCQGGVVATLADFAAVGSAFAAVEADGKFVATTAIEAHNLRPARGTRLVAVGRLISKPGRTMVASADVFIDKSDGELCLTGLFTATALIPSSPEKSR